MLVLLVVLLLLALGAGSWGYPRWGYVGLSPVLLVLIVLAVLYFTGHLHFNSGR
jgi:hypothetical protein